ncbi:hypothetical protein CF319_g4403 [Tilletia indica]|nr:hypothetical protein CF319_g4403 [Tilletia indica]
MIDSGATASFLDLSFAQEHKLPSSQLPEPLPLNVIDGRPISSGPVTHSSHVPLSIDTHQETVQLHLTTLDRYPIVLGIPWLRKHNPHIDWSRNSVTFSSSLCLKSCRAPDPSIRALPAVPIISSPPPVSPPASRSSPAPRIIQVSSSTIAQDAAQDGSTSFVISPSSSSSLPQALSLSAVFGNQDDDASQDADVADTDEYLAQLHDLVPPQYHDLLDAFSKAKADRLPPHRPHDHAIELEPNTQPPFGPLYSLSDPELKALRTWLDENLAKGFIRPSTSPAGAPILFVKKKDGSLRLCVDYRGLNRATIKNRYPLPLLNESLEHLRHSKIFTTLDLRGAYNLVRILAGDEWKTAFRTRYGHFECLVMPFGLTNAPATFQSLMNSIFHDLLDVTVVVYLDDICIFSRDPSKHDSDVREVLRRLIKHNLYCKPEKCNFSASDIQFLGFHVNPQGVTLGQDRIQELLSWPTPSSVRDVQSFLGFANFFRRFIAGYSRVALPLTRLLRKDTRFVWDTDADQAFRLLKTLFTSPPILRHFNSALPTTIETDASDFAISAILSQRDSDSNLLHPCAFISRKMNPAERNYDVHDKELLAVVTAINSWRHYLESCSSPFDVLVDHKNLEYFQTSRKLNGRQARWSEQINGHKYTITYRPGARNGKADALSRRRDHKEGGDGDDITHLPVLRPVSTSTASASATLRPRPSRITPQAPPSTLQQPSFSSRSPASSRPPAPAPTSVPALSPISPPAPATTLVSTPAPAPDTTLVSTPASTPAPTSVTTPAPAPASTPAPAPASTSTPVPASTPTSTLDPASASIPAPAPPLVPVSPPASSSDLLQQLLFHLDHDPHTRNLIHQLRQPPASTSSSPRTPSSSSPPSGDVLSEFSLADNGLLLQLGRIFVPDFEDLKVQLLLQAHDSPSAGHHGQAKTFELLHRQYTWPQMRAFVNDYVRTCDTCQRHKSSRHLPYGPLQSLPVPLAPWSSQSMDHIVELPISAGFDCILVVQHLQAPRSTLHIVSDRGTTFTSNWWLEVLSLLRIKPNLSTAFHPQTDGQTERINQVLEQYLRIFCDYLQDDWSELLPLAEFAYNNAFHSTIGMSPFFANYGFHPRLDINLRSSTIPAAHKHARVLQQTHKIAQDNIRKALETHAKYANLRRSPAPQHQPGDLVWLIRKNIRTDRPSDKLDAKRLGPFPIERQVGKSAFRLSLPPSMRVHPTFHVSLLEPHHASTLRSRPLTITAPTPIASDGSQDFQIQRILDSRVRYRKLEYLVQYVGTGPEQAQWVNTDTISTTHPHRLAFHRQYPAKPSSVPPPQPRRPRTQAQASPAQAQPQAPETSA